MTMSKTVYKAALILGGLIRENFDALTVGLAFFDIPTVDLTSLKNQFLLVRLHMIT
jgi:hypothetical protein